MWEFIKILLFSSIVSLTPNKANFTPGVHDIQINKSLSAITSGAVFYVDVTSMLPSDEGSINEVRNWVARTFKEGSLRVKLSGVGAGKSVDFTYIGHTSIAANSVYLTLVSHDPVPVRVDFSKVTFETDVKLVQVELLWKNYNK